MREKGEGIEGVRQGRGDRRCKTKDIKLKN
jgi:hypothetical protein